MSASLPFAVSRITGTFVRCRRSRITSSPVRSGITMSSSTMSGRCSSSILMASAALSAVSTRNPCVDSSSLISRRMPGSSSIASTSGSTAMRQLLYSRSPYQSARRRVTMTEERSIARNSRICPHCRTVSPPHIDNFRRRNGNPGFVPRRPSPHAARSPRPRRPSPAGPRTSRGGAPAAPGRRARRSTAGCSAML